LLFIDCKNVDIKFLMAKYITIECKDLDITFLNL